MTATVVEMSPSLLKDLEGSGLTPIDLRAREALSVELTATNASAAPEGGYVIPYYDIEGKPLPFYRVKLINYAPKYKQPKDTPNHIYFPLSFIDVLKKTNYRYVIITEGEKKAAAACKAGFPTVGVGGVDSWRNRSIILPPETKLSSAQGRKGQISAKLPTTTSEVFETSTLAIGLKDLISLAVEKDMQVIICYDTDTPQGIKPEVRRAAASFGYELRYQGLSISSIKLLELPYDEGRKEKIGIDDYLVTNGKGNFLKLLKDILETERAFPRHPTPKAFINQRLEKTRMSRRESQELSLTILTELDARGRRLKSKVTGQPYYFDEKTSQLMPAILLNRSGDPLHESVFGSFLYREYNLSANDNRILTWLASQFTGEEPIAPVEPKRVITLAPGVTQYGEKREDGVALQISNSKFIMITGDGIEICNNGSKGILFEQDQVEPLKAVDILEEYEKQQKKPLKSWWSEIMKSVNMVSDTQRSLAALLYYISPWLYRWHGIQLPVEIVCGEAGSGKSSLYSLRLNILTGRPDLRNAPNDMRDWHASIINSGGLHVTDNVQFTNRELRQKLSDEISQPLTAKVLTPLGFKPMREIKAGGEILGPQGEILTVIKEHPRGVKPIYKVTFTDNTSAECGEDHLWFVQTRDDLEYSDSDSHGQVLSLKQLMSRPLRYKGKNKRLIWFVPTICKGIDLTRKDLDYTTKEYISPYVMGCLLGDGYFGKQIFFATIDSDILERFKEELPNGININSCQKGSYYLSNCLTLKDTIRDIGLLGTLSRTKFIPEQYLYSSTQDRLDILQGLMDTDGFANIKGVSSFSSMSKDLAEGVQFLTLSLGGRSCLNRRKDGAYSVSVSLPIEYSPFYCERKLKRYRRKKVIVIRKAIKSIEYVRDEEAKCISISSSTGLYVTDNFIITHNCRIVTEPDPHIEMRRLYTTASQFRAQVSTTFAFTAIQQPFHNSDIIQRAAVFELTATEGQNHDGDWQQNQLKKFGGRAAWIAHHLVVLQRFMALARDEWEDSEGFHASHRLAHYEQCLSLVARLFKFDEGWLSSALIQGTRDSMSEADWALEGLKEFAVEQIQNAGTKAVFFAADITMWAEGNEDFMDNQQLTNVRRLGRYMRSHKNIILTTAGIRDIGIRGNRRGYRAEEVEGSSEQQQ